jgi:copper chaperone
MQPEPEMLTFRVDDMRCGHCVRAIKEAVRALDPDAVIDADLARHRVRVYASRIDPPRVREALETAGYSPVVIAAPEARPAVVAGCCGCSSLRCGCADGLT